MGNQGYAQVKGSTDEGEVLLPYTQEYLDQYNATLDKKAAQYNKTFRSKSKAEALHSHTNSKTVGGCNLITCGSFEKDDVSGGTFRTAIGGTNGEYQADARYSCWDDNGTVDWSEGQYISYSTTNSNVVYPGIIEPSTYDGGGFAIFSFQNESIDQTLTVVPNTVYTVCFEIAVIPRYNTVNSNNNGGQILEYEPNLRFGVRNGAVVVSDPLTYTDADLVQHPTSDFPTRLSFATSGNGGNQNPGGWTEINPYWENRCITFKSGPTATSVEVFYSTGNPGESVVLVDGLRLSVEGYANSPELSVTSKTYCEPTQVQLNDFVTSTTPTGAELRWSANSDLSNPLPNNPTVTTPGVWYAFYYNPDLGCTSPSRMLTLTNSDIAIAHTKEDVTCYGENDGEINITVTGGSSSYTYLWTTSDGSGLNTTAEDQTGLTAGTYKVTVDDGICTIDKSIEITQPNQINVEANEYDPLCDNADAITLTGEPTNSNGEWTGAGVTDNDNGTASFDPSGLTGTITVTYTYTDGNNCSNSDTADIVINKTATVEAGNYGPICDNADAITLTGQPTNSNGEWTGAGVTDNDNGTASFDPSGLTGTITVTYTYTDGNNCSDTDTANIVINKTATVEAGNYGPICDNADAITLTGEPTNSNGEWTGTGVTDNGNGTASFDPSGLTGTITVTYTYEDGNNCSDTDTADIVVNKTAVVEAGTYGPICDNADTITLTGQPTNSNGEWTGTGVIDNGDGTADFDPTGLNGTITATYTYTDGNNCSDNDTADIVVNVSPDAPISSGDIAECKDETTTQTLDANDAITVATGTSIVWYTDATGNTVVNDPILDTVGNVTYYAEAVSDTGSCSSSDRTPVTLTIYNCSISIEKTASPNDTQNCNTIAPGEMITYTFKVKNLGDVAINNVEVNDPLIDNTNPIPGPDSGDTVNSGVLDIGEEWTYEATYTVTQQDIINGQVNNTATVDGTVTGSSASFNVNDSDSVTVNLCQDAEISIVKSSTSESQDCLNLEVGNTIEYKFVVKNEGDVDISNVVITDPLFLAPNPVVTIQLVDNGDGNGVLNVGETWEYEAIYTVDQDNINDGQIENTATVNGTTGLGPVDETSNTITIPICQDASIALIKESTLNIDPNTGCYAGEVGEEISYTFKVKNTGDVTLTNIIVTDLVGGVTMSGGPIASLDPNEEDTTTFTATYTLTQADLNAGEFENRALATGTPPQGDDVTDESDNNSYTEDDST
ncbi:DUF11 domain-containing protein, partial [Marixanthomonas ophiurae]